MAPETVSSAGTKYNETAMFTADGILFDMDGTLTDSIAAVEAAWTAKAKEFGLEPEAVIKATHGRRASDNLQDLIPNLRKEHIDLEVEKFEQSILAFADTPPRSRRSSSASSTRTSRSGSRSMSGSVGSFAPLTPMNNSTLAAIKPFSTYEALNLTSIKLSKSGELEPQLDDSVFEDEADDLLDMSVRILPGVRSLINSLPQDKYAIATSGAKTYCHGCLDRTGITIPKVCVTADDPRLLRGKPFPDPFLLAAADLGIDPTRAVIFEDSPSGIKAAVAAGATVIAVCTSHKRHQIEHLDAHFVIDTMDQVKVGHGKHGQLEFTVTY
ncbi:phosphatase [Cryptococcus gattii Ru294]|nr:phosphatase [Cryptococcus gattii Ru294]